MWRPTKYGEEDFAAFREAMAASSVEAVVINAVYLINAATRDKELRVKSLQSLTHALRIGDAIGADGVVLHPGAQKGEPHGPSMKRAAKVIAAAVKDYDVTDEEHLGAIVDEADAKVGLERLQCLHVNDAAAPLGSCRDRHANLGKGEMGRKGIATFLSEPRFEGLPATLETPGPEKKGSDKKEVTLAKRLRREGLNRRQK